MLPLLDDYDWRAVFTYVGDFTEECYTYASPDDRPTALEIGTSTDAILRKDVVEIIAFSPGENDGPNWKMVGRLKDNRYFFVDAGCDYTGWDCQSGGQGCVSMNLDNLIRFGLGTEDRIRLGLTITELDWREMDSVIIDHFILILLFPENVEICGLSRNDRGEQC